MCLRMPGGDKLTGAGIYYGAAYTEAIYYKDKHVFVVGGANSAAQGALYLSRFASKVYGSDSRFRNPPLRNIWSMRWKRMKRWRFCCNTDLMELQGETTLEQIIVKNNNHGEFQTIRCCCLVRVHRCAPAEPTCRGPGQVQRKRIHLHWCRSYGGQKTASWLDPGTASVICWRPASRAFLQQGTCASGPIIGLRPRRAKGRLPLR